MPKIHDKYVIELKEVIKGYGNDPQVKDPLGFPCDYKFYEINGVAICEESFKKMKLLEDIAIPKAAYETRLKADKIAMLTELQVEIKKLEPMYMDMIFPRQVNEVIQKKIDGLKEPSNDD